jgi:hypothetical protein
MALVCQKLWNYDDPRLWNYVGPGEKKVWNYRGPRHLI